MSTGANWLFLPFAKLTPDQIYAILALRADVFIVEQSCAYPDPDWLDQKAFHLMGFGGDGRLEAYARIFPPGHVYHGKTFGEARIGRLATREERRGQGLGHILMKEAIAVIEKTFGTVGIVMNAQSYLEKFYNRHGFLHVGEGEFLEDDIPHIFMRRPAIS